MGLRMPGLGRRFGCAEMARAPVRRSLTFIFSGMNTPALIYSTKCANVESQCPIGRELRQVLYFRFLK